MSMIWKPNKKQEFVHRCSIACKSDYYRMVKFMGERKSMTGRASFDLTGIMDNYLPEYAYNIEDCGGRQWKSAEVDILETAISNAKIDEKFLGKDHSGFMAILTEKLGELK